MTYLEIILTVVIFLLIICQHFERKDLLDRMMSRDLNEYKGEKPQHILTAHERALKKWRGGDEN